MSLAVTTGYFRTDAASLLDENIGLSVRWRCESNEWLGAMHWFDLCAAKWIPKCLMGTNELRFISPSVDFCCVL